MSEPLIVVGNGMAATRFVDAPNPNCFRLYGERLELPGHPVLCEGLATVAFGPSPVRHQTSSVLPDSGFPYVTSVTCFIFNGLGSFTTVYTKT